MPGRDFIRILLVEDNEDDAFLFQRCVRRLGNVAEVQRTADADESMHVLANSAPPHLVILDLKLIGIDGLDVLAWIRSQPFLGGLQVVVFSSSDQEKDRLEAMKRGANGYFVKPLTAADYDSVVSTILAKHLNEETILNRC